ncbi:MAG: hypothetical protein ACM3SM_04115 [Bacteroidota bacterium]
MKKRIIPIFILLATALLSSSPAQVHSIKFSGDYSFPFSERLGVTDINAPGGTAEVRFDVYKNISLGISFGYNLYSLHQQDALKKWDWGFWNIRYKGIVQDALSKYSYLSATMDPIQKMDIYPLVITASAEFEPLKDVFVRPELGAGVMFYKRRMYLHEQWQKYFETLDYTYRYDYYNFADPKEGNPFTAVAGLSVGYQFTPGFVLEAAARYSYVLDMDGKYGYENFPMKDVMSLKLGLSFLY